MNKFKLILNKFSTSGVINRGALISHLLVSHTCKCDRGLTFLGLTFGTLGKLHGNLGDHLNENFSLDGVL